MLLIVLVCIIKCFIPSINAAAETGELTFSQLLDHNSPQKTYWNQRYFYNSHYWPGKNTSVFLLVGGEGDGDVAFMTSGIWLTWAAKHRAMLFQLEHRYYGQSHPTSDVSDKNLIKYMSSQHALADIAYFIDEMNKAYNFDSSVKWILFGGSYSGSLAAWARLKYPNQVYGSVASSGPLQATVNFYQYFQVAAKVLDYYSPGCAAAVTNATQEIQKLMDANNLKKINDYFSVCEGSLNTSKSNDRVYFFDQVVGNIAKDTVQYNKQLPDQSVDIVCSYMNNKSIAEPIVRLSNYHNASSTSCVYANDDAQTGVFKKTGWNDQFNRENLRQWRFQLCNEFGFFQTSENKTALFSDAFPLDYYTQQCTNIFGPTFNAQQLAASVAKTNLYYGGKDIKVDRVVFVQGLLDPWYPLGIINNPTASSPLYTDMASHTFDTNSPQDDDPPSVTEARKKVGQNIDKWLKK